MRNILLFAFAFLLFFSTTNAYAEDDILEVNSNPIEMIQLKSSPKMFMYEEPYDGFLDEGKFTVNSIKTDNVHFAHDNDNKSENYAYIKEGGKIEYIFDEEQNIESFYAYLISTNLAYVDFYDSADNLLKRIPVDGRVAKPIEVVEEVNQINVKKVVVLTNGGYWTTKLYEFEINLAEVYLPVLDVSSESTDESITINWENPKHKKLTDIKINDNSIGKVKTYVDSGLEQNKEYEYNISTVYSDGTEINTVYKASTLKDTTPPGSVTNLKLKQNGENVDISYEFPKDKDFDYVSIKRDETLLVTGYKEATYIDKKLMFDKEYTYTVIAYDKNKNASAKATAKIKLSAASKDVTDLVAKAENYKEVVLSWVLPVNSDLHSVKIYRKDNDAGFFSKLFKSNEVPLFETNGTNFKDLTVKSDTSYTYRVTSVYDEETSGVTVKVKTPKVSVIGGDTETDVNGDYVITWTDPTEGKVKVLVGGKEYAIVSASDKKIVIPKEKMVLDVLGKPNVQLIPILDDGTVGEPSNPGGTGGGMGDIGLDDLSPGEVLKGGVELLKVVGGFLLLALAFLIVPRLVKLIRGAFLDTKINSRR